MSSFTNCRMYLGAGFSPQPVSAEFPTMVHSASSSAPLYHQEGLVVNALFVSVCIWYHRHRLGRISCIVQSVQRGFKSCTHANHANNLSQKPATSRVAIRNMPKTQHHPDMLARRRCRSDKFNRTPTPDESIAKHLCEFPCIRSLGYGGTLHDSHKLSHPQP